jgi:hypothetical protein
MTTKTSDEPEKVDLKSLDIADEKTIGSRR